MANIIGINPEELLSKEMDRKDFLKHVGVAMIALTGVSAIAKTLLQQPTAQSTTRQTPMGYGAYSYGGQVRK